MFKEIYKNNKTLFALSKWGIVRGLTRIFDEDFFL
jgi:hypothetical protein